MTLRPYRIHRRCDEHRRGRLRRGVPAVLLVAVLALSGCGAIPGLTVEQIPLPAPGGIGDSITVTAGFDNALNLPTRAKVKLYGSNVGQVTNIVVKNYRAVVTMQVSKSTKLPQGTGAELRQATPLGDVFVALLPPAGQPSGYLGDGATLNGPTSAAATVEDLLVSTAGLVDSGSLGSLQGILTELSHAVTPNPSDPDALSGSIRGLTTAIAKFNKNAGEVDTAMDNTRVLTDQLSAGRSQIMASISKLAPALDAVDGQIGQILTTLDKSDRVTAATNDFLHADRNDLVGLVSHLSTALTGLREAAGTLGPLSDNLSTLLPKWNKTTPGSAVALSAKLYYLNPGVGFDSASRLPELGDVNSTSESLQQTLSRLLARLTGTKGCCG